MDDDGIIPEELDSLIKDLLDKGKKIKYLYTIPEFQNPTLQKSLVCNVWYSKQTFLFIVQLNAFI